MTLSFHYEEKFQMTEHIYALPGKDGLVEGSGLEDMTEWEEECIVTGRDLLALKIKFIIIL